MNADRNLLYGVIALQNDLVTRDELIEAMNAWALEKQTPLADLLERRAHLGGQRRAIVSALVDLQLARHGRTVDASIASLASTEKVASALRQVEDVEVQNIAAALRESAHATATFPNARWDASGRYRILRPHASGGLGEVFIAKDNELNREVALKRIKKQFAHGERERTRFKVEAEVTGGLEHPGIVPIYSLGHGAGDQPFYAMRFIRGESLKDAIERFHGVPPGATLRNGEPANSPDFEGLEFRGLIRRLIDVCNAIAYAHSRGVLHRDIKPSNVMIGKYGETLVVDWGLAKPLFHRKEFDVNDSVGMLIPASADVRDGEFTQPGSAMGTPAYMSPEQASGGKLDQTSDVYGLGATLYSLLTGRPPFEGETVHQILEAVRAGKVHSPRHVSAAVPKALEAVCMKAMAVHAQQRYASAAQLAGDLERWLADEPVSAWREPLTGRARRWVRKRAAAAAGTAAALLVGMIALGVGMAAVSRAYEKERQASALANASALQAETEFRRAKSAIDEFFTVVSQSEELKQKYPGMHELRLRLLEKAKKYYEAFLKERGDDPALRADAAQAFFNRGLVEKQTGRIADAEASMRQALNLRRRLVAEEPNNQSHLLKLAQSLNNFGNLQGMAGRANEAAAALKEAIELYHRLVREMPESDLAANELATAYVNLGKQLQSTGEHAPAAACFARAVAITESVVERNPIEPNYAAMLAGALTQLAAMHETVGEWKQTFGCLDRALEIQQMLVAGDQASAELLHQLSWTHHELADVSRKSGKLEDAVRHQQAAIDIRQRLVRENPAVPSYAYSLASAQNDLAETLRLTGRTADAIRHFEAALQTYVQLAEAHPGVVNFAKAVAMSHNNLGVMLRATGEREAALRHHRKSLELREKIFRDHPSDVDSAMDVAASCSSVALVLDDLGDDRAAMAHCERALEIQRRLREKNPEIDAYAADVAESLLSLSRLHFRTGDRSSARSTISESIENYRKLAEKNPGSHVYRARLAFALTRHGAMLYDTGETEEAIADYEQALSLRERLHRDHPQIMEYAFDLAALYNNIGAALQKNGDFEAAITHYRSSLELQECLVRDHPKIMRHRIGLAVSYGNLGNLLQNQQSLEDSVECFTKAIEMLRETAAADSQARRYLAQLCSWKAAVRRKQRKLDEAIADFEEALKYDDGKWRDKILAEEAAVMTEKQSLRANHSEGSTRNSGKPQ